MVALIAVERGELRPRCCGLRAGRRLSNDVGSSQRTCGRRIGRGSRRAEQEARATLRWQSCRPSLFSHAPSHRRVHGQVYAELATLTGLGLARPIRDEAEFALPAPSALRPGIRPNRARPAIPFPPFLASPVTGPRLLSIKLDPVETRPCNLLCWLGRRIVIGDTLLPRNQEHTMLRYAILLLAGFFPISPNGKSADVFTSLRC